MEDINMSLIWLLYHSTDKFNRLLNKEASNPIFVAFNVSHFKFLLPKVVLGTYAGNPSVLFIG